MNQREKSHTAVSYTHLDVYKRQVQYENTTPNATLETFLEEVALVSDIDNYDKDAPAVVMMTIHSAKAVSYTHLDVYKRQ